MSSSSPIVVSSDEGDAASSESPVKIINSPKYRRVFQLLDSSDDEQGTSCKRELKFEETDAEHATPASKLGSLLKDSRGNASPSPSQLHPLAYEKPPSKYSAEAILRIVLDPKLDYSRVCSVWPVMVESSVTFAIDVTKLKHPDDVRKDFFGKWIYSGSHPVPFKARVTEDDVKLERCAPGATGEVYYLRRQHCYHPSNPSFRRLLAFVSDESYNPHPICLVVYYIPLGYKPTALPHGNAKSSKPFYPTLPSTTERIRSVCQTSGPKEVVASLSLESGGIVHATYPGELPRDEQQVSGFKKRVVKSSTASSSGSAHMHMEANELYTIMLQAHLDDTDKKYARDIKTYPEPAILLANDRQLTDLARFCCDPFEFCVLTVDPTFCLGDFDVTPTTYRHLLLESVRTSKPPVMIGPTLIHYKKSFQTYLFFASLIGHKKDLDHLHAFGTDGEKALFDAFSHEFRFALHLTCFIHVRRNIKEKLAKCAVPEAVRNEVLDDVFGKKVGSTLLEGLVDSEDDYSFDEKLDFLIQKWKKHDSASGAVAEFCEWLLKNKVDVIRHTMLRSVREKAGLGSPPEPFFTNASECVNNIVKVKVEYKRSELPQFITKLRELCDEQEREVERAILHRGKYRLRPQYRHFEVAESKWFAMSRDQRMKHLKKVSEVPVSSIQSPEAVVYGSDISHPTQADLAESEDVSASTLCNQLMSVSSRLGLPAAAIEAIARKSAEVLKTENGVVPAPGYGSAARMVMSKSGKRPHLVTPKKNGGLACDSDCPQYQSAFLCSHVVAAAKHSKQFEQFIASFNKVSRMPNLTKLATGEMPKGRGRKGGKAPARRKASVPVENRCEMTVPAYSSAPPSSFHSLYATVNTSTANTSIVNASAANTPIVNTPIVNAPTASINSAVDISPSFHFMSSSPTYFPPYPSYIPPVASSVDPASGGQNPFRVRFVVGNISVCHGCKGRYHKELGPPHDVCVQHEEWRTYTVPGSGTPQSRFGNVYYHASPACISAMWPSFVPSSLLVPLDVCASLRYEHKAWLYSHFGVFIG